MYCGRLKKSLLYTITGSPSKLSGRASSAWIQPVKLQIKHFIISLYCFWMSTYIEGYSCGLLIKMLFPVQSRVPQGLLYSSSNTSLRAAPCTSALSPGSQTSSAVPSHSPMTTEMTGLQPIKKWECSNYAAFRGKILFASSFFHQVTENRTWRNLQRSNSPLFPGSLTAVREGGNTDNHQPYYSHGITQL